MKHLLKNTFPLSQKTASSGKNQKWFPLAGKHFSVKLDSPNFNHGFQWQKKGSEQKDAVSIRQKKKFPLGGMKVLLENVFSLDVKVNFGGSNV